MAGQVSGMAADEPGAQLRSVTLLDGGTGRELMRIGAPFRQPQWSALALIEAPAFVTRVHQNFIAAGADVITTNSYALVPFHIGRERFERQGHALATLAGRLAAEAAAAAGRSVAVAGSLPPPCGSYRADWFDQAVARPILATLVDALRPFVDHWQAETLSCIAEAKLVRELTARDGKPLWLSFTLRDDAEAGAPEPLLRSGERALDAVAAAVRLGAEAVLFNCSQPEVMGAAISAAAGLLTRLAPATGIRIGVYANAFAAASKGAQDTGARDKEAQANVDLNEIRTDLSPAGYLNWVNDWIARGAVIVGGCCGIGPEHIRAIRASIVA